MALLSGYLCALQLAFCALQCKLALINSEGHGGLLVIGSKNSLPVFRPVVLQFADHPLRVVPVELWIVCKPCFKLYSFTLVATQHRVDQLAGPVMVEC